MTDSRELNRPKMHGPAIYRIRIQGRLSARWVNCFGGMNITEDARRGGAPETVLVGRLADQTALMGVLNALSDAHVYILSVDCMESG